MYILYIEREREKERVQIPEAVRRFYCSGKGVCLDRLLNKKGRTFKAASCMVGKVEAMIEDAPTALVHTDAAVAAAGRLMLLLLHV